MKIKDQEIKTSLINRLRRIEGQIRGVQSMLDEERDCQEIMQQFAAISSSLKSTSRYFFQDYAALCLMDPDWNNEEKNRELLTEMMALLGKTP